VRAFGPDKKPQFLERLKKGVAQGAMWGAREAQEAHGSRRSRAAVFRVVSVNHLKNKLPLHFVPLGAGNGTKCSPPMAR
jgi:hypothetical protein